MPTTNCHSCGLPRADELLGVTPCPLCGADALPVADELPDPPRPVPVTPPPAPVHAPSRFGLGLAAGLLIGIGLGGGGVLGWQARPTPTEELVAAPPPADTPPLPPSPAPKSPDTVGPPLAQVALPPAAKDKPNPFPPTGPPALVLDNPDGETRPVVRPGGHFVLAGKVKRLVIPGLNAGAVLDAAQLEAEEVVVAGPVDGGSRIVVRAPGGVVRFRGLVDGGAVVDVTGRSVTFDEPIGGAGTRVTVTLTSGGELAFAAVGGSARLEYRRANANDPTLRVTAGRVAPPAAVTEVP